MLALFISLVYVILRSKATKNPNFYVETPQLAKTETLRFTQSDILNFLPTPARAHRAMQILRHHISSRDRDRS